MSRILFDAFDSGAPSTIDFNSVPGSGRGLLISGGELVRSASGDAPSAMYPLTIGGWVQSTDISDSFGFGMAVYDYPNWVFPSIDAGTGEIRLTVLNGTNSGTGITATMGSWFYVAAVIEQTQQRLYVAAQNETLALALTMTEDLTGVPAPDRVWLGSSLGSGPWGGGVVDLQRWWTSTLTLSELQAEMGSATPVRTANLWADYRTIAGASLVDSYGGHNVDASGTGTEWTGEIVTFGVIAGLTPSSSFASASRVGSVPNANNYTFLQWVRFCTSTLSVPAIAGCSAVSGKDECAYIGNSSGTNWYYSFNNNTADIDAVRPLNTWVGICFQREVGGGNLAKVWKYIELSSSLTSVVNETTDASVSPTFTDVEALQWGAPGEFATLRTRIWEAQLTEAEIIAEFNSPTAVRTANLWAAWENDSSDLFGDSSGNGRDLDNLSTVTGWTGVQPLSTSSSSGGVQVTEVFGTPSISVSSAVTPNIFFFGANM